MRCVSHSLHGGMQDGDGGRDDAQESLNVPECDEVSKGSVVISDQ